MTRVAFVTPIADERFKNIRDAIAIHVPHRHARFGGVTETIASKDCHNRCLKISGPGVPQHAQNAASRGAATIPAADYKKLRSVIPRELTDKQIERANAG